MHSFAVHGRESVPAQQIQHDAALGQQQGIRFGQSHAQHQKSRLHVQHQVFTHQVGDWLMSLAAVRCRTSWQPGKQGQACPCRPHVPDHECTPDVQHCLRAKHRFIWAFHVDTVLCCGTQDERRHCMGQGARNGKNTGCYILFKALFDA